MHFLQSQAWESFQKSLGRATFRQTGEGWEYMAVLEHGTGNSRLYCPYGPYAVNQKAFEAALDSLVSLGKQKHATFVRVEPTTVDFCAYLEPQRWRKVTYQSLNPEHTSIIDLTLPKADIIAQMAQPVRNVYRNYQKKNIHVKKSQDPSDIEIFLSMIHQVSSRTGMRPHSDDYFRAQANSLLPVHAATLWIATLNGEPIATALMYDGDTTRYYAHAAASSLPEHRKLNAGTALLAEAIIDARDHGLTSFDLYGIAPNDKSEHQAWAGFTKFKRTFGGADMDFCGTWELPLNKPAYYLYRAYQKLRR